MSTDRIRRWFRPTLLATAILLCGGAAGGALVSWYGTDPGPWKQSAAPIGELPALLNGLEQRGRDPRFVVPILFTERTLTPAELGCTVHVPTQQCCWGDAVGIRCVKLPLPSTQEVTHVYVVSRTP